MNPTLIIIDLFCGAGGLTTGAASAELSGAKVAKVIACVNHDENAINSHYANHPDVIHFTEDVRTVSMQPLLQHLNKAKIQYPDAYVLLWASLECTNFSIAKGGQSRDADSRTLADSLFMQYDTATNKYHDGDSYIQVLQPDYIYIENVKEFKEWGPLVPKFKDGKMILDKNQNPIMVPDKTQKGIYFEEWRSKIESLGYDSDWKLLNSKDFGACQSRLRFFLQFAKEGLPIVFPQPTHGKPGSGLLPYRAVKEVLELENEGISIFNRSENESIPKRQRKDLVDKTMQRIYAGLVKWIAGGDDSFLSKYFSGNPESKNISVNAPAATITNIDHHALVKCIFITKYMGNNVKTGINNGGSVDEPSLTVTTGDRLGLVQCFGIKYHGQGENLPDFNAPSSTMSTKDRLGLVKVHFIHSQYGQSTNGSIDAPIGTLTTNCKHNVVKCFIMPAGWSWAMNSVEKPSPTIIARQDKYPVYLVQIESGEMGIAVFENDSPTVEKIKLFMADYGIIDIKMRMLTLTEQMAIQGFPKDYILKGTMTQRKKYNGNAVEVNQAKANIEAVALGLINSKMKVA